jgi:alpha-ketoglutarate-dependent taurine dioxygenase
MFTLRSDIEMTESELVAFAESQGELLKWDFGAVMTMKHDPNAANYLFSDEAVPFHWDGAFYKEPSSLLFYCLESEGKGGETLFSNTELIWDSLNSEEKEKALQVTLTYETEKKAHYGGKITVPLVQTHPKTGKTILRLAEEVTSEKNPVKLTVHGASNEFFDGLVAKLYDPKFMISHEWKKGDLLLVDNFTFLHGRKPLLENKTRTFKRIQIL